jgi:hypothetical protein
MFEKNAIFSAKNWQKSQKIVIITSTPGQKYKINNIFCQNVILLACRETDDHLSFPTDNVYLTADFAFRRWELDEAVQGSILRNSILAEKFSDKWSSKFGHLSTPKTNY